MANMAWQPARLQVPGLRAAGHRIAGRQRADHGPGAAQFHRPRAGLADASNRLSLYPADYLGETERGRLAPGAWADIVVLNAELQPVAVFVEGEAIDLTTN
jgi:N-acyl-D-aspartate/D-glutamate deacylase